MSVVTRLTRSVLDCKASELAIKASTRRVQEVMVAARRIDRHFNVKKYIQRKRFTYWPNHQTSVDQQHLRLRQFEFPSYYLPKPKSV